MASLSHLSIGQKSWSLVRGNTAVINCDKITFWEPVGLLFLCGFIIKQLEISERVSLTLNPSVLNYLERINVFSFLENEYQNRIVIEPGRPTIHRRPLEGNLVEFQSVHFKNRWELEENIERLTNLCGERSKGQIPHEFIDDVFGELLDNILRHSGVNQYFVIAQSYRNAIKISVSDTGVGIPSKIMSSFEDIGSDSEAIIKATEPGVSTYPEGGWGLTTLKSYLKHTGEYLFIASNNGCVKFINNRPYIYSKYGCDFTGTFIEICFRTDVTRTPEIEDNDWPF